MANELPGMTLKAIGIVRSEIKQRTKKDVKKVISEIAIDGNLTEALDNLDEFSHIIVIYWIHQSRRPPPKKVHPRQRTELSPVGVFASRSPDRPNPIGQSIVRLRNRQGNLLTVEGLDALDGTPIIDIKPYIPGIDSVENAQVPKWMDKP